MYTLSKISNMREAVEMLELIDTDNQFYYISILPVSTAIKGRLVQHFNLL